MKLTPAQFRNRVNTLLSRENKEPQRLMYLSFADEKFLGGVYIVANGLVSATLKTKALGINPGGQIASWFVPDSVAEKVLESYRNRLLTKEELITLDESIDWSQNIK